MADIVEFLTARYDEDEEVARRAAWSYQSAARRSEWGSKGAYRDGGPYLDSVAVCHAAGVEVAIAKGRERAAHIALHDPARVLADIAAKRRIVKAYAAVRKRIGEVRRDGYHAYDAQRVHGAESALAVAVLALAAPYAEHPDYDPAWTAAMQIGT